MDIAISFNISEAALLFITTALALVCVARSFFTRSKR